MLIDEQATLSTSKDRIKFLCSHGGKILPRPSDGQLKYVGGETRIVAVLRDITFSDLMSKLTCLFKSQLVLKYQLVPEDLDSLISVTSDEDVRNMFDEFEIHSDMRLREGRSPRMRAFLFPSTPITVDTNTISIPNSDGKHSDGGLEQRYIEAINGLTRTTSDLGPSIYTLLSSCSLQNSSNSVGDASDALCQYGPKIELQRVNSSPNLLSGRLKYSYYQHDHQSRYRRSGVRLMSSQSDVARYNIDQLARRYCTPVRHRSCHSVNRSRVLVEGELSFQSRMKHRWGSPLKRSSNRQELEGECNLHV